MVVTRSGFEIRAAVLMVVSSSVRPLGERNQEHGQLILSVACVRGHSEHENQGDGQRNNRGSLGSSLLPSEAAS